MNPNPTVTLRNYLSISDLQALTNITIINTPEGIRQIDRAEQAIDSYIGWLEPSLDGIFRGIVSATNGNEIIDTNPASQIHLFDDYFAHCVIQIIGGTGAGQIRYIQNSSYNNRSVTVIDAFVVQPDTTSFYKIYQLAKFPRAQDMFVRPDGLKWYKSIPDAIRNAVAAQVEFQVEKGDRFFEGDKGDIDTESIDNYSYHRTNALQSSIVRQLSPRARALLRSYKQTNGRFVRDNPTSL